MGFGAGWVGGGRWRLGRGGWGLGVGVLGFVPHAGAKSARHSRAHKPPTSCPQAAHRLSPPPLKSPQTPGDRPLWMPNARPTPSTPQRLALVVENYGRLLISSRNLDLFTTSYRCGAGPALAFFLPPAPRLCLLCAGCARVWRRAGCVDAGCLSVPPCACRVRPTPAPRRAVARAPRAPGLSKTPQPRRAPPSRAACSSSCCPPLSSRPSFSGAPSSLGW